MKKAKKVEFDYLSNYRYKIKSTDDLAEILGRPPREEKVIMCHGVFDLVHPGHLRHLAYAKSKAEILLVSITSDRHIKKDTYRPHVPEDLRALNLAALAMVDYVIIDNFPTPIKNIERIQPDYFAKGFEYSGSELTQATREELTVLTSFGGKIIFTPGDYVLSSSYLIKNQAPVLGVEKIGSLMQSYNFKFSDIERAISEISKISVHVVGDLIIDTLTETTMIGGQIKTPTISVRNLGSSSFIGGAGVVALHLKAAGATVTLTTLLGEDQLALRAKSELLNAGVILNSILEKERPTTEKKVFVCGNYRLLKVDILDNTPISEPVTERFKNAISKTQAEIVVFSDFRHGIFHKQNINALVSSIPRDSFKAADSQVASRWGNITDFVGFDLITPNEKEARFSIADQDSTIGILAGEIFSKTQCRNLILKLGERGLIGLSCAEDSEHPRMISIDSFSENPVDPVGAGDALMAYAVLVLKSTGSLPMAAIVGSLAAACASETSGNVPVSPIEVLRKLEQIKHRSNYSEK
jgi:cytidyltransferase-like protein